MSEPYDIDRRLSGLGRRSAEVRPRSDFTDRVMLAIGEGSLASGLELSRSARKLFPAAIVLALIAAVYAVQSERDSNQALVATDSYAQELDW